MQELSLDEVYGVWYTSFWQTLPGYVILTIIGISIPLLGFAIYRMVRAYQEGTTKDKAIRLLKDLSSKVSQGTTDMRGVYQELTDIIKSYAQWRYLIPRGTTDYELVSLLESVGCSNEQCGRIERIMVDVQGVKFGRLLTLKDQVLKDITTVTLFVEEAGDRPKN